MPKKIANILAHIGGVSGAGKTTLLNKIVEQHPNILVKDIDEFDEKAKDELNIHWHHDTPFSDDDLDKLTKRKQELLDDYIKQNKNKEIVTAGIHFEDDDKFELNIPARLKLMLNTKPLTGSWRAYWRSKKLHDDGNPYAAYSILEALRHWKENKKIYKGYKQRGYKEESSEQIQNIINKALEKSSEEYYSPSILTDYPQTALMPAGLAIGTASAQNPNPKKNNLSKILRSALEGLAVGAGAAGGITIGQKLTNDPAVGIFGSGAIGGLLSYLATKKALEILLEKQSFHQNPKPTTLKILQEAKRLSDKRNFSEKNKRLRMLLQQFPDDFYIDSIQGGVVGITHKKTNFKIHMPMRMLPSTFKGKNINAGKLIFQPQELK